MEEYYIASGGEPSSEGGETSGASSTEERFVGNGADGEQGETSGALGFEEQGSELEGTGGPQGLVDHDMCALFGLSVAGGTDGASGIGGVDGELEGVCGEAQRICFSAWVLFFDFYVSAVEYVCDSVSVRPEEPVSFYDLHPATRGEEQPTRATSVEVPIWWATTSGSPPCPLGAGGRAHSSRTVRNP